MKIGLLYEDESIIAVNKPSNILIHNSYYARNIKEDTLLDLLVEQLGSSFYPIHRLDRKTSGLLILAKQKESVGDFQKLFNTDSIQKRYFGIVRGLVKGTKLINSPVKNEETQIYKDAETQCEALHHVELEIPVHPYNTSRYSLVKLKPTTGRMHQLRIHMNKISHPIIGDTKYGDRFHNRMFADKFNCPALLLHAYSIEFRHPILGKNILITADFSTVWKQLFAAFNWPLIDDQLS